MPSIVPTLIEVCEQEWNFFDRSRIRLDGSSVVGRREYDDGAWQRIGDYWRFIGGAHKNLTGKDRGTPWSAAFVSWCMNEAGAAGRFPYSAGHAKYINAAIRGSADPSAVVAGRRLKGYPVKPGDLICYWRGDNKITFDSALSIGWYQSHADIVVAVEPRVAHTIGGNVLHSVTKREVRLNADGELIDRSANWFVVLENRL